MQTNQLVLRVIIARRVTQRRRGIEKGFRNLLKRLQRIAWEEQLLRAKKSLMVDLINQSSLNKLVPVKNKVIATRVVKINELIMHWLKHLLMPGL